MNLTELTEELQRRADDARPELVGRDRLTGVHRRIRAHRRRQAAAGVGVAAITAAGVLAVALGALPLPRPDLDGVPPARPPAGRSFPSHHGGDPLVAQAHSEPGRSTLTLTFRPTAKNLTISDQCLLPANAPTDPDQTLQTELSLNGERIGSGTCSPAATPGESRFNLGEGAVGEARWAELGLRVGEPLTITLRLVMPEAAGTSASADTAPAELGIGVYAMTGKRITLGDAVLNDVITYGGRDYRLAEHTSSRIVNSRADLDLGLPAASGPVVVLGGSAAADDAADSFGRQSLFVDGEAVSNDEGAGGIMTQQAPAGARTARVTMQGQADGTAVLAYYLPVE